MYVCHCRVVTDHEVECAIADGARTVEEVGARCGAGTECASCHPELERLLSDRHARLAGAGASHGR